MTLLTPSDFSIAADHMLPLDAGTITNESDKSPHELVTCLRETVHRIYWGHGILAELVLGNYVLTRDTAKHPTVSATPTEEVLDEETLEAFDDALSDIEFSDSDSARTLAHQGTTEGT